MYKFFSFCFLLCHLHCVVYTEQIADHGASARNVSSKAEEEEFYMFQHDGHDRCNIVASKSWRDSDVCAWSCCNVKYTSDRAKRWVAIFAADTFRPPLVQLAWGRYTRCSHEAQQSQVKGWPHGFDACNLLRRRRYSSATRHRHVIRDCG